MNSDRLLEILIPSYNRPARLFNLLKSTLALKMEGVYLVVIDDGSTVKEKVENIGILCTLEVCEYFRSPNIIYIRNSENIGLARSWMQYYEQYCNSKYSMCVVDKDILINKNPILSALHKLESDESLCMVVMPIIQHHTGTDSSLVTFDYPKMSGKEFISNFVKDPSLQHCTGYGIRRVSAMKQAKVPRSLQLRDYGLEDGFGVDIDMILRLAAKGFVDFEKDVHLKSLRFGGGTELYPLTFAYTYYQYAKLTIKELQSQNMISRGRAKTYIKNWLLLILRGLVVSYQPVHGTELEKGTTRIRKHLKSPIHIYLFWQAIKYRIKPCKEMMQLYKLSLKLMLFNMKLKLRNLLRSYIKREIYR